MSILNNQKPSEAEKSASVCPTSKMRGDCDWQGSGSAGDVTSIGVPSGALLGSVNFSESIVCRESNLIAGQLKLLNFIRLHGLTNDLEDYLIKVRGV